MQKRLASTGSKNKQAVPYFPVLSRHSPHPWGSSGFTLMELMVVTAIIGILANQAVVKMMPALYKGKRAGLTLYVHAFRFACVMHYIDKGNYPMCELPCDISVYLKSGGYLEQTFDQANHAWKEPMVWGYKTNGRSYEMVGCFNGAGATYLKERCVHVQDEGSITYEEDPPSWVTPP